MSRPFFGRLIFAARRIAADKKNVYNKKESGIEERLRFLCYTQLIRKTGA